MFWIGFPTTVPPKSSTAICAAATEPGPSAADDGPDISVRTPLFTTSSETFALAGVLYDTDNASKALHAFPPGQRFCVRRFFHCRPDGQEARKRGRRFRVVRFGKQVPL